MIFRSEPNPLRRLFCIIVLLASATAANAAPPAPAPTSVTDAAGVLRVPSAHSVTVARIKASVEAKGIRYFTAIDQQQLGAGANLPIRKSMLVLFGNPPLGVQFIQSNPYAGLVDPHAICGTRMRWVVPPSDDVISCVAPS